MKRIMAVIMLTVLLAGAAAFAPAEESTKSLSNSEGFVYEIKEDGTAAITSYTGSEKDLVFPEYVDSVPVTEIREKAFYQNKKIKSVVIPGCVKTIRKYAFGFCDGLTSAEIQEGVEVLGSVAFWSCSKLKEVSLPGSISKAENGVFSGCNRLQSVSIAADHPYFEVKDSVLFSRPDHRLIWYPAAKKDKEYQVPDGTEIIESHAFHSSKINSVVLPESMREIGWFAFFECNGLKKINLPKAISSLEGIFFSCEKIATIDIPKDHPVLKSVDGVIFTRDSALVLYPVGKKDKSYTVPDGTVKILSCAFDGSSLTSVEIPGSVKEIEYNAFHKSKKLKTVILHEGIETFGRQPFSECTALTDIVLPASLINVEDNPFSLCSKLKNVTVADGNPALAMTGGMLVNRNTKTLLWYPITSKEKSCIVPKGIETIADEAIDCTKLSELILPEGVRTLKPLSRRSKFKRIVLPASLETIEIHQSTSVNLSKITFVVTAGSYAESYCQAHKLKYEYAE